jgi:hypothetical protein
MTFFRFKRYTHADAWCLTVLGVTLRRAIHQEPEPAPSGAHLAIDSSIWLSTRRHAIGFGRVREMARLTAIEVRPAGAGPFITETGEVKIEPAIALKRLEPFDVWIANHAPIRAEGDLSVQVGDNWAAKTWSIAPGTLLRLEFILPGCGEYVLPSLRRIRYQTYPSGASRFARIYGRPEFGSDVP